MSTPRPTVALIHASPASVAPARQAFATGFPDAELWNLLDDRLVVDADLAGGLTPALHERMSTLIQYALDGGAAAVQLSCSMYGPVAVDAAGRTSVPVLASDQAMFERVRDVRVSRVGVLGSLESAASDSAERLRAELASSSTETSVTWRVAEGAAKAAISGDLPLLEELMVASAQELAREVDLIVIAQYSLAPTLDAVAAAVAVPVLSPPHLAASTLRAKLTPGRDMTLLGCIADDFTGGTDVAAALRRSGLSVLLLFGVPAPGEEVPSSDAVVIALKSRTIPAVDAVTESLHALSWLRQHGTERVYFKCCSTFDSTDEGNIGPVTEALLEATGAQVTLVCPASPEHGRTTYRGHLFVGDQLLSESSMSRHPLTPMTDSNLVSVMGRQSTHPVGLLSLDAIRTGLDAIAARIKDLEATGVVHVVVDAIEAEDLLSVAEVAEAFPVLTGGAGLAGALGAVLAASNPSSSDAETGLDVTLPAGPGLVLAGSCSRATLTQVAAAATTFASYRLDPLATPDSARMLDQARSWLRESWGNGPLLMYSSATPLEQQAARLAMGPETSAILEHALAQLAHDAAQLGATRIVVAGGETSGAVVQALGYRSVIVLGEEDRGVPWCAPTDAPGTALLLKSGNFGTEDLLVRSMRGVS